MPVRQVRGGLVSLVDSDVVDLHVVVGSFVIPRREPGAASVVEVAHAVHVPVAVPPRLLLAGGAITVGTTIRYKAPCSSHRNVENEVELETETTEMKKK